MEGPELECGEGAFSHVWGCLLDPAMLTEHRLGGGGEFPLGCRPCMALVSERKGRWIYRQSLH